MHTWLNLPTETFTKLVVHTTQTINFGLCITYSLQYHNFFLLKPQTFPQKRLLTIITHLCENLIRAAQVEFASEAFLVNKYMELSKEDW